jgi:hypothetical protein
MLATLMFAKSLWPRVEDVSYFVKALLFEIAG